MAKHYIEMHIHPGRMSINGEEVQASLPEDCVGILFVFKTKEAAKKFRGEVANCIPIEEVESEE